MSEPDKYHQQVVEIIADIIADGGKALAEYLGSLLREKDQEIVQLKTAWASINEAYQLSTKSCAELEAEIERLKETNQMLWAHLTPEVRHALNLRSEAP